MSKLAKIPASDEAKFKADMSEAIQELVGICWENAEMSRLLMGTLFKTACIAYNYQHFHPEAKANPAPVVPVKPTVPTPEPAPAAVEQTIDSREVAGMIGKSHSHLMRDIKGYIEILADTNESKNGLVDFFLESQYIDGKGETRPCFLLTRKGCEMVANKMTGTGRSIHSGIHQQIPRGGGATERRGARSERGRRKAYDDLAERISWITSAAQVDPQKCWEILFHASEVLLYTAHIIRGKYNL